jgi:glycosyltransferase involved in cell wall biosynthesis
VTPGDVPALRAALERILADPELRARLGAAAYERAQLFAWPAIAERLVALYAEAASPRVTT